MVVTFLFLYIANDDVNKKYFVLSKNLN